MHRLNNSICIELAAWAPNPTTSFTLTAPTSIALDANLEKDSTDYFYNAACTFLEAFKSLLNGSFAWSTVQLYYSIFYSTRSILAINKIAIFYENRKHYSIQTLPNHSPQKESGTTHEIAFKILNRQLSIPELCQPIDGITPSEWLKSKREEANYKLAKFYDPNMPPHFNYTNVESLVKATKAYIQDIQSNSLTLTHDKDHAAIAYPLLCLKKNKDRLISNKIFLLDPDISYLSSLLPEEFGHINNFLFSD
ncbi:hypothetical protein SAMN05878276_1067 [Aquipseudomonas alcaligenes]|nr:hypothetical protein SAMN05878276_1067 [Pseudomonas alcaligenes]